MAGEQVRRLEQFLRFRHADILSYPGVRCDIPSAGYQLTFENNTQWSEFYASGPEIQEYLVNTVKKYGVYKYCKFRHLFKSAVWKEAAGKWEVNFENLASGEVRSIL